MSAGGWFCVVQVNLSATCVYFTIMLAAQVIGISQIYKHTDGQTLLILHDLYSYLLSCMVMCSSMFFFSVLYCLL